MKSVLLLGLAGLAASALSNAQTPADEPRAIRQEHSASAARESAARRALQSQAKAGNPMSAQIVEDSEIPSYDALKMRFQQLSAQLKPDFFNHMASPSAIERLAGFGCKVDITVPVGSEYRPGRLDGTSTLFRCRDGAYGTLEIAPHLQQTDRVRGLAPQALNDHVGTVPAVGRYRATRAGTTHSMLRWNDPQGAACTLDLITMPSETQRPGPADMASAARPGTAPTAASLRIKQIAAGIGTIENETDGRR